MAENKKNYKLFIILIQVILIFISSIIIISIIGNIKSNSKIANKFIKRNRTLFSKSYSHINAIFSLEIILIVAYSIIFVFFCLEIFDEIKIIEMVILFLLLAL